MSFSIFSTAGLEFLFAWMHFLAGITWIGLLYYFNFVQAPFFKETDANTKTAATKLLVPRALWWFRWAAMFTFLSGWAIIVKRGMESEWQIMGTSWGILISIGGLLGTLMFLNVWLLIWPNQKVVIAAANGQNIGDAAAAGAKALLASRTNVLFSVPMLFFMGGASRIPVSLGDGSKMPGVLAILAVIFALELNGIKGKLGPMASIPGVIHCGLGLAVVLYSMIEILM